MIAVVEVGGNQFIVKAGDIITADLQDQEVGATFTVPALLTSDIDGTQVRVGTPSVADASVVLKVLSHEKGDKIRVFKMKSKKRYSRTKGFRPSVSQMEVVSIA